MVGNLTFSRKGYEEVQKEMAGLAEEAQRLKEFFVEAIDLDTDAFQCVMAAYSLSKKSEAEKQARDKAIFEAMKEATRIPLLVLEKAIRASELALRMARKGNRNSLSDAGVAGLTASAAAEGAYCNVLINIKEITDEAFKKEMAETARGLLRQVEKSAAEIREVMYRELAG
jgi:glutamate formiminotransferase/formiminotetrahydrofolate cyclodeaminase